MGASDKKNSSHEKDGEVFYDYEVTGAVSNSSHQVVASSIKMECSLVHSLFSSLTTCALQDLHYLASITLKSGKVFALFVKSPTKVGQEMMHIVYNTCCPPSSMTSTVVPLCRTMQRTKTS